MKAEVEKRKSSNNDFWAEHHAEWRDPMQIPAIWKDASAVDPTLLGHQVKGRFWEILRELDITLIVTREYEHLIMALNSARNQPEISYLRIPHPSGIAVNRKTNRVYFASTRNPNQIIECAPTYANGRRMVLPSQTWFYPGALYLHDLAFVGGALHGNAVGQNAIVRFESDGRFKPVWRPNIIKKRRAFEQNEIQLNSIACGKNLSESFFSASSAIFRKYRPGHPLFPVDGNGVIFSGKTGEPFVRGLTRPHSARLHKGKVWVDNSGYGEVGFGIDGKLQVVRKLPGWTRGLCLIKDYAFVGTSRVIPHFKQYAPGLKVEDSHCGVHIIHTITGDVLGSLIWPVGNQIFAIDWISAKVARGLPFLLRRDLKRERLLFYSFERHDCTKRIERRKGDTNESV